MTNIRVLCFCAVILVTASSCSGPETDATRSPSAIVQPARMRLREAGRVPLIEEHRVVEVGRALESGGLEIWPNGSVGEYFHMDGPGEASITIRASGTGVNGELPIMRVYVENGLGGAIDERTFPLTAAEPRDYRFDTRVDEPWFSVRMEFINDGMADGRWRTLALHELRVSGADIADHVPTVKEVTDPLIRKHRMGTLTVRTRPGARVSITQQRHEFEFGTCIACRFFGGDVGRPPAPEDQEKYRDILETYFNAGIFENALKWPIAERYNDERDYDSVDKVLAWCDERDMPVRGHCIYFAHAGTMPAWCKDYGDEALLGEMERRARYVARTYRGHIAEYDLNNEMVHKRYFRERFGPSIVADMARWVKEEDPDAVICLNECNILTGMDVEDYVTLIRTLLDQGVPVDGIRCQGHFNEGLTHGRYLTDLNPRLVQRALDRLAQFDIPIKITEYDTDTTDEEAKARCLDEFYRVCFAHPSVDGVYMWGFWEGAHWLPRAAPWKRDWTPTPAAETYIELVTSEWHTDWSGVADDKGVVEIPAFYGTYRIEAGGEATTARLEKSAGAVTVEAGI